MESHGNVNQITVMEATKTLLQADFTFGKPEEITVKGKGRMLVYTLTGPVSFDSRNIETRGYSSSVSSERPLVSTINGRKHKPTMGTQPTITRALKAASMPCCAISPTMNGPAAAIMRPML